ncbi:MAG TPA: hypothetical protein HPP76_00460 [Desulfuromonadales bacterium]|nr:hypothetical protein [Desulfuromonadales bacterium]
MVPACPNVVGSAKAVAWGKGAGAGSGVALGGGFGTGTGYGVGLGFQGCKAACGAVLGHGLFPLAMIAAAGYLGYKIYKMSTCDCPGGYVKTV